MKALFAVALAGCSVTVSDFDLETTLAPQTVPGSALPSQLTPLFPLALSLDLQSAIAAQNAGPIASVTMTSLALHITSADDDWSFVHSLDVFVESSKSGSALPKVKLAAVSAPGAVQDLEFTVVADVNLKPYIEVGSQIDTAASGERPSDDVSFDGASRFTVHPQ